MTETRDRKPSLILPIAVATILLLSGYIGAYYWLVARYFSRSHDHSGAEVIEKIDGYPRIVGEPRHAVDLSEWKTSNARWRAVFAPIHLIDRRIRPHVWEMRDDDE